jgi:hypothetical protein
MRARLEEECKEFEMYWFEAGGGKTLLFLHIDAKRYEEDGILRDKLRAILSVGEVDINPLHFFSDGK